MEPRAYRETYRLYQRCAHSGLDHTRWRINQLEREARFGLLEMWSMGRGHRCEAFQFSDIESRTVVSIDGDPAYRDALRLRPAEVDLAGC